MRTVTFTSLINQAKQRSDLVNSPYVTLGEWQGYVSQSSAEFYQLLVQAEQEQYYLKYYTFTTVLNQVEYDLPSDFAQLDAADMQVTSTANPVWYSLKRYMNADRNRYGGFPYWTAPGYYPALGYALWGRKIRLMPVPQANVTIRLMYVAAPPVLSTLYFDPTDVSGNIITIGNNGYGLDQTVRFTAGDGLSDAVPAPLQTDIDYYAIPLSNNTFSVASSPSIEGVAQTPVALTDIGTGTTQVDTTLDGVYGWEEYVVIDAAIKAGVKQGDDISALMAQKQMLTKRIEALRSSRDSLEPPRIQDMGRAWSGGWYPAGEW